MTKEVGGVIISQESLEELGDLDTVCLEKARGFAQDMLNFYFSLTQYPFGGSRRLTEREISRLLSLRKEIKDFGVPADAIQRAEALAWKKFQEFKQQGG